MQKYIQLDKKGVIKRLKELSKLIKRHNIHYHQEDKPIISDEKFDSLVKENNHVVLISQEGEISAILANGLTENLGMRNIYSLKGGINRWIKKGYAIIK